MKTLRNSVHLIGHLGKDPELIKTKNGSQLAKFSLATNESFLNAEGEKQEEVQWHSIIAWGKIADIVDKYLKKGSEIAIEGKLIYRTFEDEKGVKKYFTEISMNEMLMLGTK